MNYKILADRISVYTCTWNFINQIKWDIQLIDLCLVVFTNGDLICVIDSVYSAPAKKSMNLQEKILYHFT